MGFSPTIREDCPGAGLSVRAGQCDGQRGEQNSQSKPPGAGQLGSTGESPLGSADPCWISPQSWKSFKALNSFLPCPSPVKPVGSVCSLIQRESSAKACSLCSPLGCDKWQGAIAVLRDDRAVLCIQTAPGGLISSDKWKALRNVSCPLKIHQEISLSLNTIWWGC